MNHGANSISYPTSLSWLLVWFGAVMCCMYMVVLSTDAESRLESERSSRQKAEKELLEMEKLIGSLRVDVSQYEQRAAAVSQELATETDKVSHQWSSVAAPGAVEYAPSVSWLDGIKDP